MPSLDGWTTDRLYALLLGIVGLVLFGVGWGVWKLIVWIWGTP